MPDMTKAEFWQRAKKKERKESAKKLGHTLITALLFSLFLSAFFFTEKKKIEKNNL